MVNNKYSQENMDTERKILTSMKMTNQSGFQDIIGTGSTVFEGIPREFLILEKLGSNLTDELSLIPERVLDLQKIVQIGVNILCRLRHLHSLGYIHSNLQPSSIALANIRDREDEEVNGYSQVFLTNLGDVRPYKDLKGVHFPDMVLEDIKLNIWCSKHFLANHRASRRDDII